MPFWIVVASATLAWDVVRQRRARRRRRTEFVDGQIAYYECLRAQDLVPEVRAAYRRPARSRWGQ